MKHPLGILLPLIPMALMMASCSNDGNSSAANGDDLAEGESHISMTLTGGKLSAPAVFEGTTTELSYHHFSSSMSAAGQHVDMVGEPSKHKIGHIIVDAQSAVPGTVGSDAMDVSITVSGLLDDEGNAATFSLQPLDGESLTIVEADDTHGVFEFDMDVSPSQGDGKDIVYHLKGRIRARD